MSKKYSAKGKLSTVVALRYTDDSISHGKWLDQPGGTVKVSKDAHLFTAVNRSGSSVGPVGSASYIAADGTEFKFRFKDSGGEQNYCVASMKHVGGPWRLPTPSYPKKGNTWDVYYTIGTTADFTDAPVFPDDILAAARCEDFNDKLVSRWIGDRSCAYLADVLAIDEIPVVGKLWCATHRLFLTGPSKMLLTRDLALAARRNAAPDERQAKLIEDALSGATDTAESFAELDHEPLDAQTSAALDIAAELANPDPHSGWANAASSWLGDAEDEVWDARARELLALVESKL